jgi:hypothetical protein
MAYTTIDKPSDYFETVLYTGNGGTNSISSLDFQPDWLWIKCRSDANGSNIFDALRGTNSLHSDTSGAEADRASDGFTSLDNDGFTLNGSGSGGSINVSSRTYAAWNWLAGGSASSNTDGSITSSVSANTTAGFSIVSYTGTGATATIGHGLGSAPKMVIVKQRSTTRNWVVMHSGIGFTKYLYLDSNQASNTGNFFNDTDPSSTVFNVVNDGGVNASSGTYIAYCFAPKKGYSKFGSYTGNGSLDAPFIYTGMKVSWLMIKRTDTTNSWVIFDNKRNAFNVVDKHLFANTNDPEDSSANYNEVDFLSNGFKLREDNNTINASGGTYIYMAFAENPFVTSSGVPACAR